MGAGAGMGPCPPSGFFGARPWDCCSSACLPGRVAQLYLCDGIYVQLDVPAAPLGAGRLCPALSQEALTQDCGAPRGLQAVGSVPCESQ